MRPYFRAHGSFSTRVEGRIVISEVHGPWNLELVEQCSRELYALAKPLAAGGPHVGLAVVHGSILCPPDALALLGKTVRYAHRHLHCIGNVLVAGQEVEGRALMEASFRKLYEGVNPFWYLDDPDSAMQQALAMLAYGSSK